VASAFCADNCILTQRKRVDGRHELREAFRQGKAQHAQDGSGGDGPDVTLILHRRRMPLQDCCETA
jgi:hypothetical protein